MVRSLHSGLLTMAVTQAQIAGEGTGQQKFRCHHRADKLLSFSTRPGLGPNLAHIHPHHLSLCCRKPWEQVPKKPKRKKSKWSRSLERVGARAEHSLQVGTIPGPLLHSWKGEEPVPTPPARGRVSCTGWVEPKQALCSMTSVPCQVLRFWVPIMLSKVIQERTTW